MPPPPNAERSVMKLEVAHQEMMLFFNAMDEVFFSVDVVNLKVIQISNGCEKLYGHKPADFLANNRLWFELIHPEDKHIVADEDEILQRGEQVNKQYRIIRKDKTVRWVENKIVPAFDETGKWVRIDGITWDTTARKEAEDRHRRHDERYRQIVETAQEGIWMIDENDKTSFVNQKMTAMIGYSLEEMLGKEPHEFMADEEKDASRKRIKKRPEGEKGNVDIKFITKNGDVVWTNMSANPIFDETGKYKGSLGMVTNITSRKQNEEALKKSEANLRTVFDNTDSSYILINPEMKILAFNALAQKFSQEINGRTLIVDEDIKNYFSEERWPHIEEITRRAAAGEIISYDLNFTKIDGNVQWNKVRWLNVKNSDNKNWGLILTNKDITKEKMAELERERITSDLIQHIQDLEQFTYIISHNLRAPVANIIGLADMLGGDDLEAGEKQEVIDRVSLSVKNIDAVIQDLNRILQAREFVNEKKELVHFQDLVDAIKTSIYNTVVTENVQFHCDFAEVGSLFTIRSYIYSIFYNLSSNSIKYRQPDVSPVIRIQSRKINNKIELRFRDNGKGIDLDKNGNQLFGLYKRFDTSMEGKGMGLFMVKTQVEALGGTIRIESKLGEGSEFIIQFTVGE